MSDALDVLVLRGGPDREREVSLMSGAEVAGALREAGHRVTEADAGPAPGMMADVERFVAEHGRRGVVFPAMHGAWGEGGPLQRELERMGARYVGCGPEAAERCMDKLAAKDALVAAGLATIPYERITPNALPSPEIMQGGVVMKAALEGSSIGLHICKTLKEVERAHAELTDGYDNVIAERYIKGPEATVGVLEMEGKARSLPLIQIVPATDYYDYEAKYTRDDTRYLFAEESTISPEAIARAEALAVKAFRAMGCRQLSRVDVMFDGDEPLFMEANTMPGFTTHSLLPMAARRAGVELVELVDRLVRTA